MEPRCQLGHVHVFQAYVMRLKPDHGSSRGSALDRGENRRPIVTLVCSASLAGVVFLTSSAAVEPDNDAWIALGARLFSDRRLSADGNVSCATCHKPEAAYADGLSVAVGIGGHAGTRNAPSLMGVGALSVFNWDGRTHTLEEQVLQPFTTSIEHGLASRDELTQRVTEDPAYRRSFSDLAAVGTREIRSMDIATALAAFVRSLSAESSAFDRYRAGHDPDALTDSAKRGLEVFQGHAGCASCHTVGEAAAATFTDQRFHALGVGLSSVGTRLESILARIEGSPRSIGADDILSDPDIADLGRYLVTRLPEDIGRFRTPSLRNVARTAPYFHDGSVATLETAVDLELYYRRQSDGALTAVSRDEREDLLAFLRALSGL